MKRVFVTPLNGKIIPLPDGNGDLPQEGKDVAAQSFWYRRLADGDITMTDVVAPEAEPVVATTLEGKSTKSTAKGETK